MLASLRLGQDRRRATLCSPFTRQLGATFDRWVREREAKGHREVLQKLGPSLQLLIAGKPQTSAAALSRSTKPSSYRTLMWLTFHKPEVRTAS